MASWDHPGLALAVVPDFVSSLEDILVVVGTVEDSNTGSVKGPVVDNIGKSNSSR